MSSDRGITGIGVTWCGKIYGTTHPPQKKATPWTFSFPVPGYMYKWDCSPSFHSGVSHHVTPSDVATDVTRRSPYHRSDPTEFRYISQEMKH